MTKEMTMEKIETGIEVAAPAAALYRALTTTEGHRGWWTDDCEVGGAVGQESVFRFDPMGGGSGHVEMRFRIDRLEPDRAVAWTCVGQRNNEDWLNTRLTFTLSPAGDRTRVDLVHSAWRERTKVYDACVAGWSHFMQSLKAYAETGTGTPHARKSR
jgi:uncharacterized protein YndB with AHSA1/START domain